MPAKGGGWRRWFFGTVVTAALVVGGNVLLVDRLTAVGVPRGAAVAALFVAMVGFYAAYALLALAILGICGSTTRQPR